MIVHTFRSCPVHTFLAGLHLKKYNFLMRFKVGIQYVGSKYSGFAINQSSVQPSVLGMVEKALKGFCNDQAIYSNLLSSSRTDAGVHALRNVFQVDITRRTPLTGSDNCSSANSYDPSSVKNGLNYHLRPDISRIFITDVAIVRSDFVARRDATARTYMYRILNRPPSHLTAIPNNSFSQHKSTGKVFRSPSSYWSLYQHDLAWTTSKHLDYYRMAQASELLIGVKDFASFQNAKCQSQNSIKHLMEVSVYLNKRRLSGAGTNYHDDSTMTGLPKDRREPQFLSLLEEDVDEVCIVFTADAFLLRMVRNMVGLLVQVGEGKVTLERLAALLDMKDRSQLNCKPAPAQGLYLVDVHFDGMIAPLLRHKNE